MSSPLARYTAFRRSVGHLPRLTAQTLRVRGLAFNVLSTPPVPGAAPLACVNGGLLFDHKLLWPALAPLARARQLVLWDQRGRGATAAPEDLDAARIEDDAEDVGAIRRALGIRRWDVLGHSWGGGIAMLGVARDPGGTRRLVTVNAVGPTSDWFAPLRAASRARGSAQDRDVIDRATDEALGVPDLALHADFARATYRGWFAHPELADAFTPPRATSVTGVTILARLRREGYDWRAPLRALSAPTLVIHGEEDALPVSVAHALDALLPRATLRLIAGAGHMPFWEAPETFFPLVESFLGATAPP